MLVVLLVATLFRRPGKEWLAKGELPVIRRALIESDLYLIESVENEFDALEELLQKEAWKTPQVRLLMTIPGVDYCTAPSLLAALGYLKRFRDGDHAASYLGLTPSVHQARNEERREPSISRSTFHEGSLRARRIADISRVRATAFGRATGSKTARGDRLRSTDSRISTGASQRKSKCCKEVEPSGKKIPPLKIDISRGQISRSMSTRCSWRLRRSFSAHSSSTVAFSPQGSGGATASANAAGSAR